MAQTARPARYSPVLSNDAVGVFALELPPGARAASFQNQHDVLWVALDAATVSFLDSDRHRTEVRFAFGDVHFFRSFGTESVTNTGGTTFHGLMVQLKKHATGGSCACGSEVEKSVCGCPGGKSLPALWALALRNVTVAGTTLAANQAFANTVSRDDTVLIALTTLDLRDEPMAVSTAPPRTEIQLQPGDAAWLAAGQHRLRNVSNAVARFITVEF